MPAEPSGLQPFLKWPGGKRWLAPGIEHLVAGTAGNGRLIEPFVGGGALFFAAMNRRSVLADQNAELICTFVAIQQNVERVLERLRGLPEPSRRGFEAVARSRPTSPTSRAARFLYLNRLAFNGVWRVNSKGEFNVPYGDRPPADLVRASHLRLCAERLQSAVINESGFLATLEVASGSDFVYCDPPYTMAHNNNGFIRYNENLFRWVDQHVLAHRLRSLARGGTRVVVSNAAHEDLLALYPRDEFHAVRLVRSSRMAGDVAYRRRQAEMLFLSDSCVNNRRNVARALRAAVPMSVTIELLR